MKNTTLILLVIGAFLAAQGCNKKNDNTTPRPGDGDGTGGTTGLVGGTARPRPKVLSVKAKRPS